MSCHGVRAFYTARNQEPNAVGMITGYYKLCHMAVTKRAELMIEEALGLVQAPPAVSHPLPGAPRNPFLANRDPRSSRRVPDHHIPIPVFPKLQRLDVPVFLAGARNLPNPEAWV